jgi:hypothetical protein
LELAILIPGLLLRKAQPNGRQAHRNDAVGVGLNDFGGIFEVSGFQIFGVV